MKTETGSLDGLADAIANALDDNSVTEVLSILIGAFVGLSVELIRRHGEDPDKQITLDGGSSRDITIHAKKAPNEKDTSTKSVS